MVKKVKLDQLSGYQITLEDSVREIYPLPKLEGLLVLEGDTGTIFIKKETNRTTYNRLSGLLKRIYEIILTEGLVKNEERLKTQFEKFFYLTKFIECTRASNREIDIDFRKPHINDDFYLPPYGAVLFPGSLSVLGWGSLIAGVEFAPFPLKEVFWGLVGYEGVADILSMLVYFRNDKYVKPFSITTALGVAGAKLYSKFFSQERLFRLIEKLKDSEQKEEENLEKIISLKMKIFRITDTKNRCIFGRELPIVLRNISESVRMDLPYIVGERPYSILKLVEEYGNLDEEKARRFERLKKENPELFERVVREWRRRSKNSEE